MKQKIRTIGLALTVIVVLAGLQRLLVPKYMGQVIEGAFIGEYYKETTSHDLLILGDCEVYENISPVTLWEEYGITSYIRGSANQLPAQSYYLLEDTLRYETPKAVLFHVAAMKMEGQDREAYNRMTMEGMKWSSSKWNAICETKMDGEYMLEYMFPLLRYHSRWQELEADDFTYYWKRDLVSHNGYYMRCDVKPAEGFPAARRQANYRFPDSSWEYLNRMERLCREKGITLILMKSPSQYPAWPEEYEVQIKEYAKDHGLLYINCLEDQEKIGLDFSQDTYNGGLHLNLYGAEKLALYVGERFQKEIGLPDHRGDEGLQKVWKQKCEFYYEQQEKQEEELRTCGFLKQFQ